MNEENVIRSHQSLENLIRFNFPNAFKAQPIGREPKEFQSQSVFVKLLMHVTHFSVQVRTFPAALEALFLALLG